MKKLEGKKHLLGALVAGMNFGAVVGILFLWMFAMIGGDNGRTILEVNRYGEGWIEVGLLSCLVLGNLWLFWEWWKK